MREELEAKIRLRDCREAEKIRKRLVERGGILVERVVEIDAYYQHPCRDFSRTDEALRIRVSENNGSRRVKVAYKGPREIKGVAKSREEIEVEVGGESIRDLLERLGFRRVAVVEKTREYYSVAGGRLIVSIDEVKGLGCFIEVEARRGEVEAIEAFLEEVGLEGYKPIYKSYLELILEEKHSTSPR